MNQAAAVSGQGSESSFDQNSKVESVGLFMYGVAIILLGFLGGLSIGINDRVVSSSVLIVVTLVTSLLTVMLLAEVARHRNIAVDQCVALAEEIGLKLTTDQVIELQRKFNAGGVFQEFVALLPSENLAQPKGNYFATSGGMSQEACRKFVTFLHNNQGEYTSRNGAQQETQY